MGDRFLLDFRELPGAGEEGSGVFLKGADPEVFGASGVEVEVAAVTLEAFGEAEGRPVGGFVKGARMVGGVVEAFGEERTVLVLFFPFVLEGAQAEAEALAGEVGVALVFDDEEAAKLDDELEPIGAGDVVPVDPAVSFAQGPGGSSPAKNGHEGVGAAFRVVTINGLPKGVASGATVAEVVASSQGEAQSLNLLAPGDGAQNEVSGVFGEPTGFQGGHGEPILHFERLLTSKIALINQPREVRGF